MSKNGTKREYKSASQYFSLRKEIERVFQTVS